MFPRDLNRPLRLGSAGMPPPVAPKKGKGLSLRSPSNATPLTPRSQSPCLTRPGMLPTPRSLPSSAGASRQSMSISGTTFPTSPTTPGARDEKVVVAVRCRPPNGTHGETAEDNIVSMDPDTQQVFLVDQETTPWRVDMPLWSGSGPALDGSRPVSQARLYEMVGRPLLLHALEGYNSTLMAYGQTGSGKTYTMMGDCSEGEESVEAGIIPRLCCDLFSELNNRSFTAATGERLGWEVHVRYVEIYCEKINDLLNAGAAVGVREEITPQSAAFTLMGARRIRVTCTDDLLQTLTLGSRWRRTAATKLNDRSSRSHAIFSVELTEVLSYDAPDGTVASAPSKSLTIRLVDLAGSERVSETGVQGTQLKEAKDINLSLFTLGCVIECLADGKRRGIKPPYRDSVLTKLLRDAFGGNSKTTMICNISPCETYRAQTIQTLNYAAKARHVLNKPRVKEDPSAVELRRANAELLSLRQQLESAQRTGQHYGSIEAELREANARLREEQKDARLRRQVMERREADLAARLRDLEEQRENYEAQMQALESAADDARTRQEKREADLRRAHALANTHAKQRLAELEEQRVASEATLKAKEAALRQQQQEIEAKMQAADANARRRLEELQRQQKALEAALKAKERMASMHSRELQEKNQQAEVAARAMEQRTVALEQEWTTKVAALEAAARQREADIVARGKAAQEKLLQAQTTARIKEAEMLEKCRAADEAGRRLQSEMAVKESELHSRVLEAQRGAQRREQELAEQVRNMELELNRRAREAAQQQAEVDALRVTAAEANVAASAKQRGLVDELDLRAESIKAQEAQLQARAAALEEQFQQMLQTQQEWTEQRAAQQQRQRGELDAAREEMKRRGMELSQTEAELRRREDALAAEQRTQQMQFETQQVAFIAARDEFETAAQRERQAVLRNHEEVQRCQDRADTERRVAEERLSGQETALLERRAELEALYQTREAELREKARALVVKQDAAATTEVELFQRQEQLRAAEAELQVRTEELRCKSPNALSLRDPLSSLQHFQRSRGASAESTDAVRMSAEFKASQGPADMSLETVHRREQRYFAAFESMYRGNLLSEAATEFRMLMRQHQLDSRDVERCALLAAAEEQARTVAMQLDAAKSEGRAAAALAGGSAAQVQALLEELDETRTRASGIRAELTSAVVAARTAETELRRLRADAQEADSRARTREREAQTARAMAERNASAAEEQNAVSSALLLRFVVDFEESERSLLEHHGSSELQSLALLQIAERRVLDREGTVKRWQALYQTAGSGATPGSGAPRWSTSEREAQQLQSLEQKDELLRRHEDCIAAESHRFDQRVLDFENYQRVRETELARQEREVKKYLLELEEMDQRKMRELDERERQLVDLAAELKTRQAHVRTRAQDMFESLLQRSVEQQSALADAHAELERASVQRAVYMAQERQLLQRAQGGDAQAMEQLLELHQAYVASERQELQQRAAKLAKAETVAKARLAEQEAAIHRYLLEIEQEDVRRTALSQQGQTLMQEAEARLAQAQHKEAAMRDLVRQVRVEAMAQEEKSRTEEAKLRRTEQEAQHQWKQQRVELERKQGAAHTAAATNERTLLEMEADLQTIVNKNKDAEQHLRSRDAEIKRQKTYYWDLTKMLEERDAMLKREHTLRRCGTANAGTLADDLLFVNERLQQQVLTWKQKFDVLLRDGKLECEKCSWKNRCEALECACCGNTSILELTPVKLNPVTQKEHAPKMKKRSAVEST